MVLLPVLKVITKIIHSFQFSEGIVESPGSLGLKGMRSNCPLD